MKGIVFTEFMDLVEQTWGLDMVDDLIDQVNPDNGGAYTSVGTYDHSELLAYVVALSKKANVDVPELVHTFGLHLASSFASKFADFFTLHKDSLEFFKTVDDHIHVEVYKLYPEAELPKFTYEQHSPTEMTLHYESSRGMADLAHGLIEGVGNYYQQNLEVSRSGKTENGVSFEDFYIKVI